jgi:hypothetical protein
MTFQICFLVIIIINNTLFSSVIFTMERQLQKFIMGSGEIVKLYKAVTFETEGI